MMTLNKSNTTLNTQAVLSMKSSGYYSQKTIGAKIAIHSIQPLLEKALKEIPNKMKIIPTIISVLPRFILKFTNNK